MATFQGKCALVLGGCGGIGVETVQALVEAGVEKIGVIDLSESPNEALLQATRGKELSYRKAQVDVKLELEEAMKDISEGLGGLDIIVNSAGIFRERDPEKTIAVNYLGTVNSTLIGVELMRRDKNGRGGQIVNIASITALGQHFWLPVYAGTKHAVLGFTRSLANEAFYEKTGLSFLVINPGITETNLAKSEAQNHIFMDMVDEARRIALTFKRQQTPVVAKCIIEALTDGQNGSVWQVENNRIAKVEIKDYPNF